MLIDNKKHLMFIGFGYRVDNDKLQTPEGPRDSKILSFIDQPSGLALSFTFTTEEWDAFKAKMNESQIIPASRIITA